MSRAKGDRAPAVGTFGQRNVAQCAQIQRLRTPAKQTAHKDDALVRDAVKRPLAHSRIHNETSKHKIEADGDERHPEEWKDGAYRASSLGGGSQSRNHLSLKTAIDLKVTLIQ